MTARPRALLIVDADRANLMLLADRLRRDGFDVAAASSRAGIVDAFATRRPDLVIIGPVGSRAEARRIAGWIPRSASETILWLAGPNGPAESPRAGGPSRSSDVVLVAPFPHRRLVEAIDDILVGRARAEPILLDDDLVLDLADGVARRGDRSIPLSPLEVRLLVTLAEHEGETVDTGALLAAVWSGGREVGAAAVWVLVWRLRRKIEADPRAPRVILSAGGSGYRLGPLDRPDPEIDRA